jgi:hypothetical protein
MNRADQAHHSGPLYMVNRQADPMVWVWMVWKEDLWLTVDGDMTTWTYLVIGDGGDGFLIIFPPLVIFYILLAKGNNI